MGKIFSGLTFSRALELLLEGHKITRSVWHHEKSGVWIGMQAGYPDGIGANENTAKLLGVEPGTPVTICPYVVMRTVGGALVPWTPNMIDLMASDWNVVTAVGTAPEGWEAVDRGAGKDGGVVHDGAALFMAYQNERARTELDQFIRERVSCWTPGSIPCTIRDMSSGTGPDGSWWVSCQRHGFKVTGLPSHGAAMEVIDSLLKSCSGRSRA